MTFTIVFIYIENTFSKSLKLLHWIYAQHWTVSMPMDIVTFLLRIVDQLVTEKLTRIQATVELTSEKNI